MNTLRSLLRSPNSGPLCGLATFIALIGIANHHAVAAAIGGALAAGLATYFFVHHSNRWHQ